jgi:thiamine biosynthesis lipoprotein
MKMWEWLYAPLRLALVLTFASLTARSLAAANTVTLTGRAMGTTWSVKYIPLPPTAAPLDAATVSSHLEHLEGIFSTYRPASELSRFNASPTTAWLPVSAELAHVARASRRISELTSGAFDATIAPLVLLWGFGPTRRTDAPPADSAVAAARLRVDYRQLEIRLDPPSLRKQSAHVTADFSSLAKGYAADSLSTLLTSLGAPDHFVQIGGDIKTSGQHPWITAIENPLSSSSRPHSPSLAATLSLAKQSLSTSGDTRNFFTLPGSPRRYGHIIDPRTGHPVSGPLASVSVVHPSCAESSGLATALFVLGPDAGFALALRENLVCLFIYRDDDIPALPTPAFKRLPRPSPLSPP